MSDVKIELVKLARKYNIYSMSSYDGMDEEQALKVMKRIGPIISSMPTREEIEAQNKSDILIT